MAKKRISESAKEEMVPLEEEGIEEASPPEQKEGTGDLVLDIQPPKVEEGEEKPYTLGEWRGRRQWKCKFCPWDTLKGEAEILKHVASHMPPPPKPTGILVADKSGRVKENTDLSDFRIKS